MAVFIHFPIKDTIILVKLYCPILIHFHVIYENPIVSAHNLKYVGM